MGHDYKPAISHREHARLAETLIEACGGPREASRYCRVSPGVLSTYQNPHRPECSMPADVIADLEKHCGRAIYSIRLAELCKAETVTGCIKEMALDLAQEAQDAVAAVRLALADNRLTPNDLDAIAAAERDARVALERLAGARAAIEAASPTPLRAA